MEKKATCDQTGVWMEKCEDDPNTYFVVSCVDKTFRDEIDITSSEEDIVKKEKASKKKLRVTDKRNVLCRKVMDEE